MGLLESVLLAAILALALRRAVLLAAAMRRPRPLDPAREPPSLALLVPARNEAAVLPRLLAALSRLDYPAAKLSFVLVSDGSTDATAPMFRAWAATRTDTRVLELSGRQGKAAALNAGLGAVDADLVVVVDADLPPPPDFVQELARAFADPRVGAAAAYLAPENADQNMITRYAAVNMWVHQLVTSAGADRLGLNPQTLGAAAYRRTALESIGGFASVPISEDVATSGMLSQRGWRVRFVRSAVARLTLVSDLRQYWHQHVRWVRGAYLVRPQRQRVRPAESWPQRLESAAASLGYTDRIVFALAAVGAASGLVSAWIPLVYLVMPGAAILAALYKAGTGRRSLRFVAATIGFFAVDVVGSAAGLAAHLARQPYRWHHARQAPGR
jgi:cellulose synthase/poly-beta-1,6-N-acetylglucosamine synthase-like glycosyltransferase